METVFVSCCTLSCFIRIVGTDVSNSVSALVGKKKLDKRLQLFGHVWDIVSIPQPGFKTAMLTAVRRLPKPLG